MSGTKIGGQKAAATNVKMYGKSFYGGIGAKGGRNGRGKGGFASNPALAREAGAKGGRMSRRGPARQRWNWVEIIPKALKMYTEDEMPITKIARSLEVPYCSLRKQMEDYI